MSKAYGMLQMILRLNAVAGQALSAGATVDEILANPVIEKINRSRYVAEDDFPEYRDSTIAELDKGLVVAA
jgi:V/A-type H+-transporting ATPase subunit A